MRAGVEGGCRGWVSTRGRRQHMAATGGDAAGPLPGSAKWRKAGQVALSSRAALGERSPGERPSRLAASVESAGSRRRRELSRSLRLAKCRKAGLRRHQDGASDQAGALEDTARHGVDRLDEVGGRADGTRLNLRLGCQGVRFGRRRQVRCTMPTPVWKAGANVQATCQQSVLTSSAGSQESTPGFFSMISAASSLPSMSTSTA